MIQTTKIEIYSLAMHNKSGNLFARHEKSRSQRSPSVDDNTRAVVRHYCHTSKRTATYSLLYAAAHTRRWYVNIKRLPRVLPWAECIWAFSPTSTLSFEHRSPCRSQCSPSALTITLEQSSLIFTSHKPSLALTLSERASS